MDSEASSSYYSVERALAVRRGEHVSHNKHVVVEYKCLCSPQGMDEYFVYGRGFFRKMPHGHLMSLMQ